MQVFTVKSCSDAHIALSSIPGDTTQKTYEIVLGGWSNTKSVIRIGRLGAVMMSRDTPGLLVCDKENPFWIAWKDNLFEVGQGFVYGQQKFLSWKDGRSETFLVNSMSFATGWGAEAYWTILQLTGTLFHILQCIDHYFYGNFK